MNYSGVVLEKICEYFLYNEKNTGQENVQDMDIPPELCLELLMAADYLDSESLSWVLGLGCRARFRPVRI